MNRARVVLCLPGVLAVSALCALLTAARQERIFAASRHGGKDVERGNQATSIAPKGRQ